MTETNIRVGTQSITLDGDYKSTWPNAWSFYHVKNIGESDALVSTIESLESLVAPTEEDPSDVMAIPAGASLTVPGRHSAVLLTSGKVQVVANNNPSCPFKSAQVDKDIEQPGRIYIFEANYICPGWSYSLTPANTFINSTYCSLSDGKTLTLSGHYPEGFKFVEFIIEAPSSMGESIGVEFFDTKDGALLYSMSYTTNDIKGRYLVGMRVSLNNDYGPKIYDKDVNIVITGTAGLKISRIFIRKP